LDFKGGGLLDNIEGVAANWFGIFWYPLSLGFTSTNFI
jgi:hypothetical protein